MPRAAKLVVRTAAFLHGVFGLGERRCVACHAPFLPDTPHAEDLCLSCRSRLARFTAIGCPLCGTPAVAPEDSGLPCGNCLLDPPPWSILIFHGLYADLLQALLLRLKFGGDFSTARLLGNLLAKDCAELPPVDAIVPLPRHPVRLRGRGFNQAGELARAVALRMHVPLKRELLFRTMNPPPQEHLTARQRQKNPEGSFSARNVHQTRILLIDDTMTTGATLRHAARALRDGGAGDIYVAVAARTPPPGYGTGPEKA